MAKATDFLKIATILSGLIIAGLAALMGIDEVNQIFYYAMVVIILVAVIILAWAWDLQQKNYLKVLKDYTEAINENNALRIESNNQQREVIENQKKSVHEEEKRYDIIKGLRAGVESIMELVKANNDRVEYSIEISNGNTEATKKLLNEFSDRIAEIDGKQEKLKIELGEFKVEVNSRHENIENRVTEIEQKMKRKK